jgi:hypothetical protein
MSEIVWQDPPDPRHNRAGQPRKWEARLLSLMEQPKRWALLLHFDGPTTASSTASFLRRPNGSKGACITPPGKWEYISRLSPDRKGSDLYARYLGPEDEA